MGPGYEDNTDYTYHYNGNAFVVWASLVSYYKALTGKAPTGPVYQDGTNLYYA